MLVVACCVVFVVACLLCVIRSRLPSLLFVACCLLRVVCFVSSRWLIVGSCLLCVVGCFLYIVWRVSFVVRCLLWFVCCMCSLLVVCSLFVGCSSKRVVCCVACVLLFGFRNVLFVVFG